MASLFRLVSEAMLSICKATLAHDPLNCERLGAKIMRSFNRLERDRTQNRIPLLLIACGSLTGAAIGSASRRSAKPVLFAVLPTVRTPWLRASPMAIEIPPSRKSRPAIGRSWRGLIAAVVVMAVVWGGVVLAANNS